MANFKLGIDKETDAPAAFAASRGGDNISEAYYKNKTKLPPGVAGPPNMIVKISSSDQNIAPGLIDVVNNYDWTVSPKNEIVEHPYIILHEYKINGSPMLSELSYRIKTSVESSAGAITGVANLNSVLKFILGDINLGDEVNKLNDLITKVEGNSERLEGNLYPFDGLYYLKKTDFNYKFPYFTNTMANKQNTWERGYSGDSSTIFSDIFSSGFEFVAKHGAGIPLLGSYAEPGLYIERGRYFNPVPGMDPIKFSFPLLNTLNESSIQQNFNLIWLLCFQNCSIRRNKVAVIPPCIYRALIPGVRFMLYCAVENISINYVGTRRRINITHPASGKSVEVIIPEAYKINLTINSLTTDNGNFMLSSLRNDL
jgi:hypothetical protein